MILKFNTPRARTLKNLCDFMVGNESLNFEPVSRLGAYRFIEATLNTFFASARCLHGMVGETGSLGRDILKKPYESSQH